MEILESYDFALMKLEKPCSIRPARLDITNYDLSTNYNPGRKLWAVGYGKKDYHDSLFNLPSHLQHVQVVRRKLWILDVFVPRFWICSLLS